jgi:hypothetical protein
MSLIADLESIARRLPPSHVPSPQQIGALLGALVLVVEHGDDVINAANPQESGENGLLQFLTDRADQHNAELAADQANERGGTPAQPAVPGFGVGQSAPVFSSPQPTAPASVVGAAPAPASPTMPGGGAAPAPQVGQVMPPPQVAPGAVAQPSYAELIAAVQQLSAQLGGRNQAASTVETPDHDPAPDSPEVDAGSVTYTERSTPPEDQDFAGRPDDAAPQPGEGDSRAGDTREPGVPNAPVLPREDDPA